MSINTELIKALGLSSVIITFFKFLLDRVVIHLDKRRAKKKAIVTKASMEKYILIDEILTDLLNKNQADIVRLNYFHNGETIGLLHPLKLSYLSEVAGKGIKPTLDMENQKVLTSSINGYLTSIDPKKGRLVTSLEDVKEYRVRHLKEKHGISRFFVKIHCDIHGIPLLLICINYVGDRDMPKINLKDIEKALSTIDGFINGKGIV